MYPHRVEQAGSSRQPTIPSTLQLSDGSNQISETSHLRPLLELYAMSDDPERELFLDNLISYMDKKGKPINYCPTISKKPLDLYRLYLSVREMGGYIEVSKARKWSELASQMGFGTSSSAKYTLRCQYQKNLLPYECEFERGGIEPNALINMVISNIRNKSGNISTIKRLTEDEFNVQRKRIKHDLDSNQAFADFSGPLPLQSMAIVSIATSLWSEYCNRNVERYFKNLFVQNPFSSPHSPLFLEFKKEYLKVEKEVKEKVTMLVLPDALKIKISSVVRPIGLQIFRWIFQTSHGYDNHGKEWQICWTAEGTIDQVKMFHELINNKMLKDKGESNIFNLFKLACIYCFEEFVSELWMKMPTEDKSLLNDPLSYDEFIIAYWVSVHDKSQYFLLQFPEINTHHISNDSNVNINENMILLSLHTANIFAFKYFWFQLSDCEKDAIVKKFLIKVLDILSQYRYSSEFIFLNYNAHADILCFLLAQLHDHNQQKEIFQSHSKIILDSLFYNWPSQNFFLPTIVTMFEYLTDDIYVRLMSNISYEIKEGGTACQIFKDVWCRSPLKLKQAFLDVLKYWTARTLVELLNVGDINFVCAMLSDCSAEEKKQIMFRLAYCLVYSDNINLVDTLTSRTLSSEQDLYTFRQNVILAQVNGLWDNPLYRKDKVQAAKIFMNWAFDSLYKLGDFKKGYDIIYQPMRMCLSLILWDNFECVSEFLKWCFKTEDKIHSFKLSLLSKDNYHFLEIFLLSLGKGGKKSWYLFEKFINYLQYSSEEIDEFKKLIMGIVKALVCQYHLEFVTLLLNWCFESNDDIHQFKHELLFSKEVVDSLLDSAVHESLNYSELRKIFNWFAPLTSDIISKLKSVFSPLLADTNLCHICEGTCFRQNNKQLLFYLLNSLMEDNSKSDCANISNNESLPVFEEIQNDPLAQSESEIDSNSDHDMNDSDTE